MSKNGGHRSKDNTSHIPEKKRNPEENANRLYREDPFFCEVVMDAEISSNDLRSNIEPIDAIIRDLPEKDIKAFQEKVNNIRMQKRSGIGTEQIVATEFKKLSSTTSLTQQQLDFRIKNYRRLVDTVMRHDAEFKIKSFGKGSYLSLKKLVLDIRKKIKADVNDDAIISELKLEPGHKKLIQEVRKDYNKFVDEQDEKKIQQDWNKLVTLESGSLPRPIITQLSGMIQSLAEDKNVINDKYHPADLRFIVDYCKGNKELLISFASEFKRLDPQLKSGNLKNILGMLKETCVCDIAEKYLKFYTERQLKAGKKDFLRDREERQKICEKIEAGQNDDQILQELMNEHYSLTVVYTPDASDFKLLNTIRQEFNNPVLAKDQKGQVSICGYKENQWRIVFLNPDKFNEFPFPISAKSLILHRYEIPLSVYEEITTKAGHSFVEYADSEEDKNPKNTQRERDRLRALIEPVINFIHIDSQIRNHVPGFEGISYGDTRGLIVNIRKGLRAARKSVQQRIPGRTSVPVTQLDSSTRPSHTSVPLTQPASSARPFHIPPRPPRAIEPAPLTGIKHLSPWRSLMNETADQATDSAAALWTVGIRIQGTNYALLPSSHLSGVFSGIMQTPKRYRLYDFFASLYNDDPYYAITRKTRLKVYEDNPEHAQTIVDILIFTGEPHEGQELAIKAFLGANSEPFLGRLQKWLNKGEEAFTSKAFKFIVAHPAVLIDNLSRIYLTATGFFELMKICDWLTVILRKGASTRQDPQRAVMENLLRQSAKILEEIFVNSATTLNPLNPGISRAGKKAILKDCIEKHRYFDFVKALCLFKHGDKFIFICHDQLMELLISTTTLDPDKSLWRSMGVLAEAPGNEPGVSSLNRLNVIEPRQDKIIHRIIKKISAEIKLREGQTPSPDNSVSTSQIELTMEESSRFPRVPSMDDSSPPDLLASGSSFAIIPAPMMSSASKEKKINIDENKYEEKYPIYPTSIGGGDFPSVEAPSRSTPEPFPLVFESKGLESDKAEITSDITPKFELMPAFLNLATVMVDRITQMRSFNSGNPIPETYPEEFFAKIQSWGEEYCFLFILAVGCAELPVQSTLTFSSRFKLLINFVTWLKNDDLITFVAKKFGQLAAEQGITFEKKSFCQDSYKTFLLNPIGWSAREWHDFRKVNKSAFAFAFDDSFRKMTARHFREIQKIILWLSAFSQSPRDLNAHQQEEKPGIIPLYIKKIAEKLKQLQDLPLGLESFCGSHLKYMNLESTGYDEWNIAAMYTVLFIPNHLQGRNDFQETIYGPSFKLLKDAIRECHRYSISSLPASEAQRRAALFFTILQFPPELSVAHHTGADIRYSRLCRDLSLFFVEFFHPEEILQAVEWLFSLENFINDGVPGCARIQVRPFFNCLLNNQKFVSYLLELSENPQGAARFAKFKTGCTQKLRHSLPDTLVSKIFTVIDPRTALTALPPVPELKSEEPEVEELGLINFLDDAASTIQSLFIYVERTSRRTPEIFLQKREKICFRLVQILEACWNTVPSVVWYTLEIIRFANLFETFREMNLDRYPAAQNFQNKIRPYYHQHVSEMRSSARSQLYSQFILFRAALQWVLNNYTREVETTIGCERLLAVCKWLYDFSSNRNRTENLPVWEFSRALLVQDFKSFTNAQLNICIALAAEKRFMPFRQLMRSIAIDLLALGEIKADYSTGFFDENQITITTPKCQATFFLLVSGVSIKSVYRHLGEMTETKPEQLEGFIRRAHEVFEHVDQLLQDENTYDPLTLKKLVALRAKVIHFFVEVGTGLNQTLSTNNEHEKREEQAFRLKVKAIAMSKQLPGYRFSIKDQTILFLEKMGIGLQEKLKDALMDLFAEEKNYRFLMHFVSSGHGSPADSGGGPVARTVSHYYIHPGIFRAVLMALLKTGWELPIQHWPKLDEQLSNVVAFCSRSENHKNYLKRAKVFYEVVARNPQNFIDFFRLLFDMKLPSRSLHSLDDWSVLQASHLMDVVCTGVNKGRKTGGSILLQTQPVEVKTPDSGSSMFDLSRLLGSFKKKPKEVKEIKGRRESKDVKNEPDIFLSNARKAQFLSEAEAYALEFIEKPGNEFCGLLESRAAKIAAQYRDILLSNVAESKTPVRDKNIALRILLILNDTSITEEAAEKEVNQLLMLLWTNEKAYFHLVRKLDHYMKIRFGGTTQLRIKLLEVLTPPSQPLVIPSQLEVPAREWPKPVTIPPKSVIPRAGAIIKLLQYKDAKREDHAKIPVSCAEWLNNLPEAMQKETAAREFARLKLQSLQQEIPGNRKKNSPDSLHADLDMYSKVISQEGWECVEPIIAALIEKLCEVKDFAYKSPFAGAPLRNNLNEAFSDLLTRSGFTLSASPELINKLTSDENIHVSTAMAVILLRIAQAYRHPYAQQPSAAERRMASIAVKNLHNQLHSLFSAPVLMPQVQQYREWREYFQTLVWLARTIDPASFVSGSADQSVDLVQKLFDVLEPLVDVEHFKYIHRFLISYHLLLPEHIDSVVQIQTQEKSISEEFKSVPPSESEPEIFSNLDSKQAEDLSAEKNPEFDDLFSTPRITPEFKSFDEWPSPEVEYTDTLTTMFSTLEAKGLYLSPSKKLVQDHKSSEGLTLLGLIVAAYPSYSFLQPIIENYRGPSRNDASLFNQHVFALAFNNPNQFLGYFSALTWRQVVNESAYGRRDGGKRLVKSFDWHTARLKKAEMPLLLFHGICAAFNITCEGFEGLLVPRAKENNLSALTRDSKKELQELFKHYFKTASPDSNKNLRLKALDPVTETGTHKDWIEYFIKFLGILVPEVEAVDLSDLENALLKSESDYQQNQALRAWCWTLVHCIPRVEGRVNDMARPEMLHHLKRQLGGQLSRDKRTAQLFCLFKIDTPETRDIAEALGSSTATNSVMIEDMVRFCVKTGKPPFKPLQPTDKIDRLFFSFASHYQLLSAEDQEALSRALQNQREKQPLAFSLMAQIMLQAHPQGLPDQRSVLMLYANAEELFLQQEPDPEIQAKKINQFYEKFRVKEEITYLLKQITDASLNQRKITGSLAYDIHLQVMNAKAIIYLTDQLSERYCVYATPEFDEKDAKNIPGNAFVLTNDNQIYRSCDGRWQTTQGRRLVMEIKSRGEILPVASLTRIDRGHEENIRRLFPVHTPNKFEKGLRRNTLPVIARQMEKIARVLPPQKGLMPDFECLVSEETTRQVLIAETFLRSLDSHLDREYKDKAIVLCFSEGEYKNLNLTGRMQPIFSPWAQAVWAFNYYHYNQSSRVRFIKSADFFKVMKRLLEFEGHSPFYKTLLVHNYLESLPEMKTDSDCWRALEKAKRLYWRSFSWSVTDSYRGAYLAESCARFVTGKTIKNFVEEIDQQDLFVEFADKIMYESRDKLPEIKAAISSDLTGGLVAFVKTFLAISVRTTGPKSPDEIFADHLNSTVVTQDTIFNFLRLITFSIDRLPSSDLCWKVSHHLLNTIESSTDEKESKGVKSAYKSFDGFILALETLLRNDKINLQFRQFIRDDFLLLIKNRYSYVETNPKLIESYTRLNNHSEALLIAAEKNSREVTGMRLQDILTQLRTDPQIRIGVKKEELILQFSSKLDQVNSPDDAIPSFQKLCEQMREVIVEAIYEAQLTQRRELVGGLTRILESVGLPSHQLSDPNAWNNVLGADMAHRLCDLQSVFMRWKNIYPLMGMDFKESKASAGFILPVKHSVIVSTFEQSRTKKEFRALLLKQGNPRHFFGLEFIGTKNGEGKIIRKLLNYYLTNGNDITDKGEQTNTLLELIEKNAVTNPYLFKNIMEFIFELLNPANAEETEQRRPLGKLRAFFMEMLLLHWNQLARAAIDAHWDNPPNLYAFRENLLDFMRITFVAFLESGGQNFTSSQLPGSLMELQYLLTMKIKSGDELILNSVRSLVNVKTAAALSTGPERSQTEDPDLLSAGACVITHTLGALHSDVLPGSFRTALETLLQEQTLLENIKIKEELELNPIAVSIAPTQARRSQRSLVRLRQGEHFSDQPDEHKYPQFGFSVPELLATVVDEVPIPLQKFNSKALESVSDYNLRENISNIVDTLDTLGGCSLIKLRGSDSKDSKNEDPELQKMRTGDLKNLRCQGTSNAFYIRDLDKLYYFQYHRAGKGKLTEVVVDYELLLIPIENRGEIERVIDALQKNPEYRLKPVIFKEAETEKFLIYGFSENRQWNITEIDLTEKTSQLLSFSGSAEKPDFSRCSEIQLPEDFKNYHNPLLVFDNNMRVNSLGYAQPRLLSERCLEEIEKFTGYRPESDEDEKEAPESRLPGDLIRVPRTRTVGSLLQGMMRTRELILIINADIKPRDLIPRIENMDFPAFENYAAWYDKFRWIAGLLNPQQPVACLFDFRPNFAWRSLSIFWGGCDLVVMDAEPTIENIKQLNLISNAVYIRYGEQLFYANNINEVVNNKPIPGNTCTLSVVKLKEAKESFSEFDARLKVSALMPGECRKLTAGQLIEIFNLTEHTHLEKVERPWEDLHYQIFHAIEKRYLELLLPQREAVRDEVLRDVPSDLREVADGEDIILLGLITRWEDAGVVSYIDQDQVARRKLFANFDKFGRFLSRLFIDTERSRLGNAHYFPLINGIVADTKNEKIFIPDALDNKIKNILIRSELRKYFLRELAAVCLSDNIQPLLAQLKNPENRKTPIASKLLELHWTENLLETAWTVLAHEMLAPPQLSWLRQTRQDEVNYFEIDDSQLQVAAHEDMLLIHHLIEWRTKIGNAFSSRSQAIEEEGSAEIEYKGISSGLVLKGDSILTMQKVDCLRDFLIIFKDRFAQNRQDCFTLYKNLVNWAIGEWFASGKSKTAELIEVFRLSSIAGLGINQLDCWVECAQNMVFVENTVTSKELFDALSNYEPPFTCWTLVEDYLESRPARKEESPFRLIPFLEQYLREKHQTGMDFFADTLFDRDAYNATSFIACVLRKLGMNGEKMLVNFGDMVGKNSLQNQLIEYLKSFQFDSEGDTEEQAEDKEELRKPVVEAQVRLNGFIHLLLGLRIELLDREPTVEERKRVVEQKCVYIIKKPGGRYELGVYIPKIGEQKGHEEESSRYQQWPLNLPEYRELLSDRLSQPQLDGNYNLRQAILNYASDVCGSVSLGAMEAWPAVESGKEFTRRIRLNDIPRPSGNLAAMIMGVAESGYDLYIINDFDANACVVMPGSADMVLPGGHTIRNAIIINANNKACLIRMGKIVQQDIDVDRKHCRQLRKGKLSKITTPPEIVCSLITEVTTKAGRTYCPNLEIVENLEEEKGSEQIEQRLLSKTRIKSYDEQLPFAIAHRLFKNFTNGPSPACLDELNEKSWLKPLRAYVALLGYKRFTEEGGRILDSDETWTLRFQRMVKLMEKTLGITIRQDIGCQNIIETPEFKRLMELFQAGIAKFSEFVLTFNLILPPRAESARTATSNFSYKNDLGVLHAICEDSTVNEKNFRTHCLELLTKLAQLTNPSIADPVPPSDRQSKLLLLSQLPQEQELAGYSGNYLLVGNKFKFDGQKSVDDTRIEFTNLHYIDEMGISQKLYSFPDANFNAVVEESILSSEFDVVLMTVDPSLGKDEIENEAKKVYEKYTDIPVIVYQKVFKLYFDKQVESTPNYFVLGKSDNRLILTKTSSAVARVRLRGPNGSVDDSKHQWTQMDFPVIGSVKLLAKNSEFSEIYKEIIGKKAHYLENGKLRSKIFLKPDQVKKFSFAKDNGELQPVPAEQKGELIWLENLPAGEIPAALRGKIVFISTELMPKLRLAGQRSALETSILRSNLYFVYQGRLTGVRVPAHGAKYFNKKLSQLMKKSGDRELILSSQQVDELINRGKSDPVLCAQAGNLFPLHDNLLKFLQGGNRPTSIQSIIIDREIEALPTIPSSAPMPQRGRDTGSDVSGLERKIEVKGLDIISMEKDKIAQSRTSAFSVELSEPVLISQSNSEQKALINHVNSGGSLYSPLSTENENENEEDTEKFVDVTKGVDSIDLNF